MLVQHSDEVLADFTVITLLSSKGVVKVRVCHSLNAGGFILCRVSAHPEPEPDQDPTSSSLPPSYPETQRAALSSAQRIPP